MFKECLANGIVPFIITDELKMFYYRGLQNWPAISGYLRDTYLTAQDNYRALLLRQMPYYEREGRDLSELLPREWAKAHPQQES